MSTELFDEWAREIDRKFGGEKRKIALIVNNCPVLPHVEKLDWVELNFLPLNTTLITQSMHEGIIHSTKAKYHSLVVKKLISALVKRAAIPKISVLSALIMLRKALNDIP